MPAQTTKPVQALEGIDLDIAEGEFFGVIGPSGCGKSTLMDITAGLVVPSEGEVNFAGRSGAWQSA